MFSLIKRSGRLAGICTTYAGVMFGGVWLLDRWLVWQLVREAHRYPPYAAPAPVVEPEPAPTGPRCSVWTCDNAPTADIHGWLVCGIHDPREAALPNGQPADVKGS